MTDDVRSAVYILGRAIEHLQNTRPNQLPDQVVAIEVLTHAIRHLAYPDRDIYPKTRKGTKGAPIVRRKRTADEVR